MIVAVKRNRKQKIIRVLSLVFVAAILVGYYFHNAQKAREMEEKLLQEQKALKLEKLEKQRKKKEVENIILNEVERAVSLIGQENVVHVKIIENKLVLVCESKTNLEPLMVRYGVMAAIKKTLNQIIIAIDIKYIVESNMNV